jgi:hypothetical protein
MRAGGSTPRTLVPLAMRKRKPLPSAKGNTQGVLRPELLIPSLQNKCLEGFSGNVSRHNEGTRDVKEAVRQVFQSDGVSGQKLAGVSCSPPRIPAIHISALGLTCVGSDFNVTTVRLDFARLRPSAA